MHNLSRHFWYKAVIVLTLVVILLEVIRTKITWLVVPEAICMVLVIVSTGVYWHRRNRERRLK